MLGNFASTLAAIERIKHEGVVADYAIGGAMALVFWTEPVATYDLDVFVILPSPSSLLVTLDPIYRWAEKNGFATESEHIVMHGIPVQFIPAHDALADEAIAEAVTADYEGTPVRVMRPEHRSRAAGRHPPSLQSETAFMTPPRPSEELLIRLRAGKQELHRRARALPLPEKVRRVVELQRLMLPLIARRRPLRKHERVWGEF